MANSTVTVSQLDTLVSKYTIAGGVSAVSLADDSTTFRQYVDRGLRFFSREAYFKRVLSQSLTISANDSSYDCSPMWLIEVATLDGDHLLNREGNPGPESLNYLYTRFPTFQTDTGTPKRWVVTGDSEIYIHPTPTVSGTLKLAGFVEHTSIVGAASGTILEIPDFIVDVAALFIAIQTKFPHMQGGDVIQEILAQDEFAYRKFDEYRRKNRARGTGLFRRTAHTNVVNL